MAYSEKDISDLQNYLQTLEDKKLNCEIPTSLRLDSGIGMITCVSNIKGWYGFRGISFNYYYGKTSPMCVCGHNMCFQISSISGKIFSDSHWVTDTEENQKELRQIFFQMFALLYEITEEELYSNVKEYAQKLKEEKRMQEEWNKYLKYLKNWSETHSGTGFYGMSPACFDEWEDNEYEEVKED